MIKRKKKPLAQTTQRRRVRYPVSKTPEEKFRHLVIDLAFIVVLGGLCLLAIL